MSQEHQMRSILYDNTVRLPLSTDMHPRIRAFVRIYRSVVVSRGSGIGNAVESCESKSLFLSNRVPPRNPFKGIRLKRMSQDVSHYRLFFSPSEDQTLRAFEDSYACMDIESSFLAQKR